MKRVLKEVMMDLAPHIVVILAFSTVIGFLTGAVIAAQYFDEGGCNYPNLAARTNPGYALACELGRKRW